LTKLPNIVDEFAHSQLTQLKILFLFETFMPPDKAYCLAFVHFIFTETVFKYTSAKAEFAKFRTAAFSACSCKRVGTECMSLIKKQQIIGFDLKMRACVKKDLL